MKKIKFRVYLSLSVCVYLNENEFQEIVQTEEDKKNKPTSYLHVCVRVSIECCIFLSMCVCVSIVWSCGVLCVQKRFVFTFYKNQNRLGDLHFFVLSIYQMHTHRASGYTDIRFYSQPSKRMSKLASARSHSTTLHNSLEAAMRNANCMEYDWLPCRTFQIDAITFVWLEIGRDEDEVRKMVIL